MISLIQKAFQGYNFVFEEMSDHRLDHLPLMSSPIPMLIIGFGYLMFVYKWGPNFMKNRQPFQLEGIILIYNLLQVFANTFLIISAFPSLLKSSLRCTPIDYSDDPEAMKIAYLGYFYLLVKLADLTDTVFFIFRKKFSHVSFLQVYHHAMMFVGSWIAMKFWNGGHGIYVPYLNAIVHAIMYSYYFLTSWDTKYKKNIWWKKHVTQLQMVQFLLDTFIYGSLLFRSDCSYPKTMSYIVVTQNFTMLWLFGSFYYKAYIKPKKTLEAKQ